LAAWCAEGRMILFAALTGLRQGELLGCGIRGCDLMKGRCSWMRGPIAAGSHRRRPARADGGSTSRDLLGRSWRSNCAFVLRASLGSCSSCY
jgi:hypothetical protein